MDNKTIVTKSLTATSCGSKYKRDDIAKARPICDTARRHIAAYVTSHKAIAQVWAIEVGHKDMTAFVVVPAEQVSKISVSAKASLIFDDEEANIKARRFDGKQIPRTAGHGLAATFVAASAAGLKPESWRSGVAQVAYKDLPIGDDNTRSREIEDMVVAWATTWPGVKYAKYTGQMKGNAWDAFCKAEHIAKESYTPDVFVRMEDGSSFCLEVKGRLGRQPAPQKFRDEWGLE